MRSLPKHSSHRNGSHEVALAVPQREQVQDQLERLHRVGAVITLAGHGLLRRSPTARLVVLDLQDSLAHRGVVDLAADLEASDWQDEQRLDCHHGVRVKVGLARPPKHRFA
jgi:hypothetical protein